MLVPGGSLSWGLPACLLPTPVPLCSLAGEARSSLRWADGKSIKNEVDLQVGVAVRAAFEPSGRRDLASERSAGPQEPCAWLVSHAGSAWEQARGPGRAVEGWSCWPCRGEGPLRWGGWWGSDLAQTPAPPPLVQPCSGPTPLSCRCCTCWAQRQKLTWKRNRRYRVSRRGAPSLACWGCALGYGGGARQLVVPWAMGGQGWAVGGAMGGGTG